MIATKTQKNIELIYTIARHTWSRHTKSFCSHNTGIQYAYTPVTYAGRRTVACIQGGPKI